MKGKQTSAHEVSLAHLACSEESDKGKFRNSGIVMLNPSNDPMRYYVRKGKLVSQFLRCVKTKTMPSTMGSAIVFNFFCDDSLAGAIS